MTISTFQEPDDCMRTVLANYSSIDHSKEHSLGRLSGEDQ